jgi:hypothetical protein
LTDDKPDLDRRLWTSCHVVASPPEAGAKFDHFWIVASNADALDFPDCHGTSTTSSGSSELKSISPTSSSWTGGSVALSALTAEYRRLRDIEAMLRRDGETVTNVVIEGK